MCQTESDTTSDIMSDIGSDIILGSISGSCAALFAHNVRSWSKVVLQCFIGSFRTNMFGFVGTFLVVICMLSRCIVAVKRFKENQCTSEAEWQFLQC